MDQEELSVVKTEPCWEDEGYEFNPGVKEERIESMGLTVTNALPSVIPSDSPSERKNEDDEEYESRIDTLLRQYQLELDPPKTKPKKKISCSSCDFQTPHRFVLIRHNLANHREKKYACTTCGFKTGYQPELVRHQKHSHCDKGFPCGLCASKYSTRRSLKRHMLSKHDNYSS